jgi:ABC-type nitrate/sulfonate/bicarbonate transport system ATPase subunit
MGTGSLELIGVNKSFSTPQGSLPVLDQISFSQNAGEVVSIVGASGSGKTTLLRIVAGLEAPDNGEVRLDGMSISGPGPERALIFQQFGLMPWLNVLDNVLFGLKTSGLSSREQEERAHDAIRRVGLEGFEDFHPKRLSGGMQQRVGIARAIAVKPALLLCDEPFASVDAMTRQTMQTDLLNIVTQEGASVLLVTHDIEEALFLGDRVVMFSSRPARVIEEIDVAIPKPREHSVRTSVAFQEQRAMVWDLLQAAAL